MERLERVSEKEHAMTKMSDYESYDAVGLAELVRTGATTPMALLEAAIEGWRRAIPRSMRGDAYV
jgi:hypothetical protein